MTSHQCDRLGDDVVNMINTFAHDAQPCDNFSESQRQIYVIHEDIRMRIIYVG